MCFSATTKQLELNEIQNELEEVNWYQLGVQLGLKPYKLEEFQAKHPRDVQNCKTEVLNWWLDNEENTSWEKLAKAVEKNHSVLAKKLREKS